MSLPAISRGAVLLMGVLVAFSAYAHKTPVKRKMMLEAWKSELHIAATIKIPGRLRSSLAFVTHKPEEIKKKLVVRTLANLELTVNNATVALDNYEAKLRMNSKPDAPIELMLHGTVSIPKSKTQLGLRLKKNAEALELILLPGTRKAMRPTRGTVHKGKLKLKLRAQESVGWSIGARND